MYVIEHRRQNGEIAHWELSRAVPRDADGEPVELGDLGVEGAFDRKVVTEVDALDVLVHFLKQRVDQGVRVSEVERAMDAAEARAPKVERRITPRSKNAEVDYGRSGSGSGGGTIGSRGSTSTPRTFPVGRVLVVLAILAALWWFFVR